MSRAKKQEPAKKLWERAKWLAFVNVTLNSQEKDQIKKEEWTEDGSFLQLQGMAEDGYKVSLSYSPPEEVYTVSATGVYKDRPNAGMTMSMRHKDILTAVAGLVWCHQEAGKNGEWADRFGNDSDVDW